MKSITSSLQRKASQTSEYSNASTKMRELLPAAPPPRRLPIPYFHQHRISEPEDLNISDESMFVLGESTKLHSTVACSVSPIPLQESLVSF